MLRIRKHSDLCSPTIDSDLSRCPATHQQTQHKHTHSYPAETQDLGTHAESIQSIIAALPARLTRPDRSVIQQVKVPFLTFDPGFFQRFYVHGSFLPPVLDFCRVV
jgi:hypothetical protein